MPKNIIFRNACLAVLLLFTNAATLKPKDDQSKSLNIVFIGDSITEANGLDETPPAAAVSFLKNKKTHDIHFSNQGHSGFTTVDFLPGGNAFTAIKQAADSLQKNNPGVLLFSIMIGTNDSAEEGPNGSPVAPDDYYKNLQTIIDALLKDFPGCRFVIHHATWYSPGTYNSSRYLQAGLNRLQSYSPIITKLVNDYKSNQAGIIREGDHEAFNFFRKNYKTDFVTEHGQRGIFYLHPNNKGAKALGEFWAKAILRNL